MAEEKGMRDYNTYYENALCRLQNDKEVSDRNKEIVSKFLRDAALGKTVVGRCKKKIGPRRRSSYVIHLMSFIKFTKKDIDQITEEDMEAFVEALDNDVIKSQVQRFIGQSRQVVELTLAEKTKVERKV